jgi:peptidoglycan/xylan/chitin deacetylase (PgdA/CDA1 family)
MSWDDARVLARSGFTVGAHGLAHAILTNESDEVARNEIRQSMLKLSAEIGSPCSTFAFPNGNYTNALAQYAHECGARIVMTTDPTWAGRNSPLWRLPRIQLFGSFSRSRIALKLAASATGWLLTNPDGTGRSYASGRRVAPPVGAKGGP